MPRFRLPPPSETGWTSVPPKASKRTHTPLRLPTTTSTTPLSSGPESSPPCKTTLLAALANIRRQLHDLSALKTHISHPPSNLTLLEIHGLGSLHGINAVPAQWQLALALEFALAAGITKIRVFDPVFTSHDRELLESLGCEVNPGPGSGDEEKGKALFAPHLEYDVLARVLGRDGWEWVCCNDLREFVEMRVGMEKEREVFEGYLGSEWTGTVVQECPEAAEGRAFNHLGVYGRRED